MGSMKSEKSQDKCDSPSAPLTCCHEYSAAGTPKPRKSSELSFLDKYLTLWIVLAVLIGFGLSYVPGLPAALSSIEYEGVNLLVGIPLILMMVPPLSRVQYDRVPDVLKRWRLLLVSVAVNWAIGPMLMYLFGSAVAFSEPGLLHGIAMVGCARCIAMVVVWNRMAGGDGDLCAVFVLLNTVLSLGLYTPFVVLYTYVLPRAFGIAAVDIDSAVLWFEVIKSVSIYLVIPLAIALAIWLGFPLVSSRGRSWYYDVLMERIAPVAITALLFVVVAIFAMHGSEIVPKVKLVAMAAAPLTLYYVTCFFVGYYSAHAVSAVPSECIEHGAHHDFPVCIAMAFTAASNNFELALAVAIGVFGPGSDGVLAAVAGVLFEIPVMLSLVHVSRWLSRTSGWKACCEEDVKRAKYASMA